MGLARPLTDRDEKDKAHALMLKGRVDQAIAIYRALVARTATDAALWLLLADAQRKRGLLDDSVRSYRAAAKHFAAQGHVARARAAVAVALRFAPGEPALLEDLRMLRPQPAPRHLALVPPPVATPAGAKSAVKALPAAPAPAPVAKPAKLAAPPAYPLDVKPIARAVPRPVAPVAKPAAKPVVKPMAKPPPPVPPLVEEDIDQVLEVGFLDLLGDVESDDEMKTELFCPVFDWLEETPDSGPHVFAGAKLSQATVLARPRRR